MLDYSNIWLTFNATIILIYDYQITIMKLFKRPFLIQKADKLNSNENSSFSIWKFLVKKYI